MYSMLMVIPATVKNGIVDVSTLMILGGTLESIEKFIGGLIAGGVFDMPQGDPRYRQLWEVYRKLTVTALKTAKAYVTTPMETCGRMRWFPRFSSIEEIHNTIGHIVDKCMSPLYFVPNFASWFGNNIHKDFSTGLTALSLVGMDMVASIPDAVWNSTRHHYRLQGYSLIVFMVNLSRRRFRDALHSSDPGLIKVHRIAMQLVEDLETPDLRRRMGPAFEDISMKVKNSLLGISALIKDIESDEYDFGDRKTACAVKRANILSVLPCSSVFCSTVCPFGKNHIPAKCCSACKIARYCSAHCQKEDWKVHKVACKALAAAKKS